MTRLSLRCAWILFMVGMAGCTAFRRDAEVSRDQWEPPVAESTQ